MSAPSYRPHIGLSGLICPQHTHNSEILNIVMTKERAQTLKKRFSSHQGNKRQTKKRLLSGLIKCGSCGGSMTIVNRERYSCSAKREKGTSDNTQAYRPKRLRTEF